MNRRSLFVALLAVDLVSIAVLVVRLLEALR